MNGADHYTAAEQLLEQAVTLEAIAEKTHANDPDDFTAYAVAADKVANALQRARTHAELAAVAAQLTTAHMVTGGHPASVAAMPRIFATWNPGWKVGDAEQGVDHG
jgi:heterodisulfide reductase subunit A-like polyferredoxin